MVKLSFLLSIPFFVITSEGFCWNNSLFIFSPLSFRVLFFRTWFSRLFSPSLLLYVEKYLIHDQKDSTNEEETSKQMTEDPPKENAAKVLSVKSNEQGSNLFTLHEKLLNKKVMLNYLVLQSVHIRDLDKS